MLARTKQWAICIILLLILPKFIFASLIPVKEHRPFYEHLYHVNKQWIWGQSVYSNTEMDRTAVFANDTKRIQAHLSLVEKALRKRSTTHLSPQQSANRLKMLEELNFYHQNGQFPSNHYHKQRMPYFIDNFGIACAVGYLIIESGYADLANTVKEEMNNGYIAEIDKRFPQLQAWADEYGFTMPELAWIQPTYQPVSPAIVWDNLGTGTDLPVEVMYSKPKSNILYIGGPFTQADGVASEGIVQWDGYDFIALGEEGLSGTVLAIAEWNGTLYAGGFLTNNEGSFFNLAKWNGQDWTYHNVANGSVIILLTA